MSTYENLNQEALDAQQQFEAERKEISGVQVTMNPGSGGVTIPQQQPKSRPGWTTKDGSVWFFSNYDNLPSEYKQFIPREATKSAKYPNATGEQVIHQDPFDGQTYKYGVTFFDNGGSSVWSRIHDPNKPSGGSGFRKSFYLDVGLQEMSAGEANALLAANEGEPTYRYKLGGSFVMNQVANGSDGSKTVVTKIVHVVLKQKRIEYGG